MEKRPAIQITNPPTKQARILGDLSFYASMLKATEGKIKTEMNSAGLNLDSINNHEDGNNKDSKK